MKCRRPMKRLVMKLMRVSRPEGGRIQAQIFPEVSIRCYREPVGGQEQPAKEHGKGKGENGHDRDAQKHQHPADDRMSFEDVAGAGHHDAHGSGGEIARIPWEMDFVLVTVVDHPVALRAFGGVQREGLSAERTAFRLWERLGIHSGANSVSRRCSRLRVGARAIALGSPYRGNSLAGGNPCCSRPRSPS